MAFGVCQVTDTLLSFILVQEGSTLYNRRLVTIHHHQHNVQIIICSNNEEGEEVEAGYMHSTETHIVRSIVIALRAVRASGVRVHVSECARVWLCANCIVAVWRSTWRQRTIAEASTCCSAA